MKRIIRISQKNLNELLMNETGFLSGDKNFAGGSYRNAPESAVPATPAKINISLTEEQINFLEDILEEVNPDNDKEKEILFTISHLLRDTLINSNK